MMVIKISLQFQVFVAVGVTFFTDSAVMGVHVVDS